MTYPGRSGKMQKWKEGSPRKDCPLILFPVPPNRLGFGSIMHRSGSAINRRGVARHPA